MEDNNQALRLAQMMLKKVKTYQSYELALPLVEVGRSKLKKLSVDDVLLLGLDELSFVLIENEKICAHLTFIMRDEYVDLEVLNTAIYPIQGINSKKYQTVIISFGKLQSRKPYVGHKIDISYRSLQEVELVVEGNKYASGTLVNVNGELAVKIDKVGI